VSTDSSPRLEPGRGVAKGGEETDGGTVAGLSSARLRSWRREATAKTTAHNLDVKRVRFGTSKFYRQ
jgi:hypothetical protein